jgi:single-stranded DNA-binding protein
MSQDSNARRNMTVVGNLTADPELRYTPSGKAVAKFGLAVNKGHKEGDKWVEDPCRGHRRMAGGRAGHFVRAADVGSEVGTRARRHP